MNAFYQAGRVFQFIGLIVLPLAISGNVAEKLNLKESLIMSGVGMVIFFFGWLLQEAFKPKS